MPYFDRFWEAPWRVSNLDRADWLTRSLARTRRALMHISQIRPNHYVRLSAQIEYSVQEIARGIIRSALFLARTNAPRFLPTRTPLPRRSVRGRNLRGRDLEEQSRSSGVKCTVPSRPTSGRPKAKSYVAFIVRSLTSWVGITDISSKSCCLNSSARASVPRRRYR